MLRREPERAVMRKFRLLKSRSMLACSSCGRVEMLIFVPVDTTLEARERSEKAPVSCSCALN